MSDLTMPEGRYRSLAVQLAALRIRSRELFVDVAEQHPQHVALIQWLEDQTNYIQYVVDSLVTEATGRFPKIEFATIVQPARTSGE
jgi:hypothetical protein